MVRFVAGVLRAACGHKYGREVMSWLWTPKKFVSIFSLSHLWPWTSEKKYSWPDAPRNDTVGGGWHTYFSPLSRQKYWVSQNLSNWIQHGWVPPFNIKSLKCKIPNLELCSKFDQWKLISEEETMLRKQKRWAENELVGFLGDFAASARMYINRSRWTWIIMIMFGRH